MPTNVASSLVMTAEQRVEVEAMARSSSLPVRKVAQATSLLLAAEGISNRENARRSGTTRETVIAWRKRFDEQGVPGIGTIAPGRGRKPRLPDGTVAEVVRVTQQELPADTSTQWSTRSLAKHLGIGKDTVARIWRARWLRPWKVDAFKLSRDPNFEAKFVDVVGLYLDRPERAVVLSFDEKTQVQALDRTQPSLPRARPTVLAHDDP